MRVNGLLVGHASNLFKGIVDVYCRNGKTFLRKWPSSYNREPSDAQKAAQDDFKSASLWTKELRSLPTGTPAR